MSMSDQNHILNLPLNSYLDDQISYFQPSSISMLSELSWPCQFLSPSLTPQYMDMPVSPVPQVVASSQAPGVILQRQQPELAPLSARPSISSTQISRSSVSSNQTFVTTQQPHRKQDRERRRAQNRTSQRAYRERKEVQLRDLAASLKSTETAMAVIKVENRQLRARLERMKKDLEVLSKENEVLRRMDRVDESARVQSMVVNSARTSIAWGAPIPPLFEEYYDSGTRSNTVSIIGTPKDVRRHELVWNGISPDLKEMLMVSPSIAEGEAEDVHW